MGDSINFKIILNGNQCPRKSGLSSLYDCLLCLPLCRARSLSLLKHPDLEPCLERACHSAFRVCCRKNVLLWLTLCFCFPTWCLCWEFKFNCMDSLSLYSYSMNILFNCFFHYVISYLRVIAKLRFR